MAKTDFLKVRDLDFLSQMQTFKNTIGNYAIVLDLSPAEVAAQAADADFFKYICECQQSIQNSAQAFTAWKNITRVGGTLTGTPQLPVFPPTVPVVAGGVEARFRALVKKIKAHPNYTISLGDGLGIESPNHVAPDLATIQPVISLKYSGDRVHVVWGWGGHGVYLDMIEIQVDRGDGKGFVLLAYDTTPGYIDPTPMPAAPVKWTYRAGYRVGDQRVGEWSAETAITVGG